MNTMSYRGYMAHLQYDASDQIFVGHITGINDVISFHGETVAELESAFQTAVDDYIEACAKVGKAPEKAYGATQPLTQAAPETDIWP
jgi:predicted HicB family RNase H-like nuclease